MADRNLFDQLSKGIADAVTDIRQKVVEEPYFGRAVTEGRDDAMPQWPQAQEQESEKDKELGLEQEPEEEIDLER
jgi:hypothetical protein